MYKPETASLYLISYDGPFEKLLSLPPPAHTSRRISSVDVLKVSLGSGREK
jgi:hypothetical protein